MKITRFYFSLILLFVVGSSLFAQGLDSAKIDALVDRVFETTPSVGIAVAVVKDGEIIHSKGYGIRSIEGKENICNHKIDAERESLKEHLMTGLHVALEDCQEV